MLSLKRSVSPLLDFYSVLQKVLLTTAATATDSSDEDFSARSRKVPSSRLSSASDRLRGLSVVVIPVDLGSLVTDFLFWELL